MLYCPVAGFTFTHTNLLLGYPVFCRAAQINSAVTMRLFVGELAKQVVQL